MSSEESNQTPSPVRLQRIESVIGEVKEFKVKLGEKTLEVTNRRGKKLRFDPVIAEIASAMLTDGHDPATCKKSLIIAQVEKTLKVSAQGGNNDGKDGKDAAKSGKAAAAESASADPDSDAESGKGPKLGDAQHNALLPVLTLALSQRQCLAFDKKPGADRRKALVEELIASCTNNL